MQHPRIELGSSALQADAEMTTLAHVAYEKIPEKTRAGCLGSSLCLLRCNPGSLLLEICSLRFNIPAFASRTAYKD